MRALFVFVLLTFVASWLLWIAAGAVLGWDASRPSGRMIVAGPIYLLGVFAPALVALALTAHERGRAGVRGLLRRAVKWSVAGRWYVFAVGYFAAVKLAVAVVHRAATGAWPALGETPWFVMLAAVPLSTPSQAGEEIGWRGFALPRLSARLGLPMASIVLGIIWGLWHLPFFFVPGTDKSGQSFPAYLVGVTALSAAMAWLYWRTEGSLLLTMVMHAAVNNTNLVPVPASTTDDPFALRTSLVAWLTPALLAICAVYFLLRMRGARLPLDPEAAREQ